MLEKCSDDFKPYEHLPFLSPGSSHLFEGFIAAFWEQESESQQKDQEWIKSIQNTTQGCDVW